MITPLEKVLRLELNNFPCVPIKLRTDPAVDSAVREVKVKLANIWHQHFLDTYGAIPSLPSVETVFYESLLLTDPYFRFRGNGLGAHKEAKIGEYNKMGRAFCRWFLQEF